MAILVTGGAGYIGSHTCVELLENNYEVIVIDNYSNSSPEVLEKIKMITRKNFKVYDIDLLDEKSLEKLFEENDIEAVIHFAGYKAVGESVKEPLKYYKNNLKGTLNLLEVMDKFNVKKIVFSSSATVYGDPKRLPIKEDFPLSVTNPYGRTKLIIEEILRDLYKSDNSWSIIILRYFNPIGANVSVLIGEDPKEMPNNLMPYIVKVAKGELERLSIFGNDYPTEDGTGVRDYIHVVDLAEGHVKAMEKLDKSVNIYNLGTGKGTSVLELLNAFKEVNNIDVPYDICERRAGDIATCYADVNKVERELNWKVKKDIKDMVRDAWEFEQKK